MIVYNKYDDFISATRELKSRIGEQKLTVPIETSDRTLPIFLKKKGIDPDFTHAFWMKVTTEVRVIIYEEHTNPVFQEPIL